MAMVAQDRGTDVHQTWWGKSPRQSHDDLSSAQILSTACPCCTQQTHSLSTDGTRDLIPALHFMSLERHQSECVGVLQSSQKYKRTALITTAVNEEKSLNSQ